LIGSDGSQLGIFTAEEARQMAYSEGLDLVEMSANADPPVCRIMNYDKFRYEQKKKQTGSEEKTDYCRNERDQVPPQDRGARSQFQDRPHQKVPQPEEQGETDHAVSGAGDRSMPRHSVSKQ